MRKHNICYHFYADDTQLYISFDIDSVADATSKLESCIEDIRKWMATNFLCLNDGKTEFLLIGKTSSLKKCPDVSVKLGNATINPSDTARNIGAIFDNSMTMSDHISSMCKSSWFQLNRIGKIRKYLTSDSAKTLVHAFVASRLDSFNSLLYGVPKYEIKKLQRIQNSAARLISGCRKYDHITPILIKLHWLPIEYRIEYKILVLTYKAIKKTAPQYIIDLVHERKYSLEIPMTITKCGERSISYASPYLWNRLPDKCKKASSLSSFKGLIKTHLFKLAYDV